MSASVTVNYAVLHQSLHNLDGAWHEIGDETIRESKLNGKYRSAEFNAERRRAGFEGEYARPVRMAPA